MLTTRTPVVPASLFALAERCKERDPLVTAREEFYDFTCRFWLAGKNQIVDYPHILAVFAAVPDKIALADGMDAKFGNTEIALDTSRKKQEEFVWHVNSVGEDGRVRREITVGERVLTATLNCSDLTTQAAPVTQELGGDALVAMADATIDIAEMAAFHRGFIKKLL